MGLNSVLIANELALASEIKHTNSIEVLAGEIGYRPALIINALYEGERLGKFKWDRKKGILTVDYEVLANKPAVMESTLDLCHTIEELIRNLNSDEKDMSFEELFINWLPGVAEMHVRMAVRVSQLLTTYELTDPKDKESTYTFITLAENLSKEWGRKQFNVSKKKAK